MFVVVLLVVVHCATAALPVFGNRDPLIIDVNDMEGFLYEVPEYEDPQVLQHQLSSLNGGMPMFSLLDLARKHAEPKDKDNSQSRKIAESMKALEDIIYRLEATRTKLENGNSNIYIDLEKSIQGLKNLERSFRPDIRALFSSLRNMKPSTNPTTLPNILEMATTTRRPALFEKSSILETPEKYAKKMIDIKIISKGKSILDQSLVDEELENESKIGDKIAERDEKTAERDEKTAERDEKTAERDEKIAERDEKIAERDEKIAEIDEKVAEKAETISKEDVEISEVKPINIEARADTSPEVSEVTTTPFETQEYQIKGKNIQIDRYDTPNLYQSKWTWNTSRRLS